MYELGKKNEILAANKLKPLSPPLYNRPERMPYVPAGHKVICGYDQGLGERIIVCESLEDMQELYDNYAQGWALRLHWYTGEDLGSFRAVIVPSPEKLAETIAAVAGKGLSQAMNFSLDTYEKVQGGLSKKDAFDALLPAYPGVTFADETLKFPDGSEATLLESDEGLGFIISDEHRKT